MTNDIWFNLQLGHDSDLSSRTMKTTTLFIFYLSDKLPNYLSSIRTTARYLQSLVWNIRLLTVIIPHPWPIPLDVKSSIYNPKLRLDLTRDKNRHSQTPNITASRDVQQLADGPFVVVVSSPTTPPKGNPMVQFAAHVNSRLLLLGCGPV